MRVERKGGKTRRGESACNRVKRMKIRISGQSEHRYSLSLRSKGGGLRIFSTQLTTKDEKLLKIHCHGFEDRMARLCRMVFGSRKVRTR
jgi:hypothetical protein